MSWIFFGIIILIAVIVIWKWWKKPYDFLKKNDTISETETHFITEEKIEQPSSSSNPPPMVFAVNDHGNLDLTDINGKILNIGFGAHPKTYIILLDWAEKDTEKIESENSISFNSKVGNTKSYEAAGHHYIINYTRL